MLAGAHCAYSSTTKVVFVFPVCAWECGCSAKLAASALECGELFVRFFFHCQSRLWRLLATITILLFLNLSVAFRMPGGGGDAGTAAAFIAVTCRTGFHRN